ncbi:glycosyl transferase [Clostridia bacterium]|nr:glycosyl transferase [Clostridia bacterium]
MFLIPWESIPKFMKNEAVYEYYKILKKRIPDLIFKRIFDVIVSTILIILFSPLFLVIGISIKLDSKGSIFFRQERVTQYGKIFKLFKFRTMCENADLKSPEITVYEDLRITKIGKFLRKYRIDEIPQLFNLFIGDLTFVGTRPEVKKYVSLYSNEMLATLLLPAGVTSNTSIIFKDEDKILKKYEDPEIAYTEYVLPEKMKINLEYLKHISILNDFKIIFMTVFKVLFS